MDRFKLETSIQFPFFKLNELISYSEVKKPSGFAYMLLVLINESIDKKTNLSNVLISLGIPKSLHYIYANTIQDLIDQDILIVKTLYSTEFDRSNFSQYVIGDFKFTPKGKKVFAEESITTGITKEVKIPIYYNVAVKQLSISLVQSLEARPLSDSAIDESFVNKFRCEKDIEDFINSNKGIKIPIYEKGKVIKNELIKKEEVVTKVEDLNKENWIGKYECLFEINGDTLTFKFEDNSIQKFFNDNYTREMIIKAISLKTKFNFKSANSKNLRLSLFNEKNIVGIIVPKEIDGVFKQKGKLLITKGNYTSNNYYAIESKSGIDKFSQFCEFIIVDQLDNKIAYIPGVFDFNSDLGVISIPLVLKLKISNEEMQEVLNPYISSLSVYSEDNFRELIKVVDISKDYELAYKVLEGYVSKDNESNITLLNEMKSTALLNSHILTKYKELLALNYYNYLKDVTEDNLDTTLKISSFIPKFLNISNKVVLDKIFEALGSINNKIKIFETLVNRGFNRETIILYVNPISDVLNNRDVTEKSLIDLINYDNCISSLKSLCNIKDFKNYVFNEEEVNKTEFKNIYLTAKNIQNNINYLKSQNSALFSEYDSYMQLFGTINDDFNMIDSALKNPNNIKSELIEKKITSGDYQFVFVNLSAKLEIILKNKYKLDGKLSDMLNEARKTGEIDKNIVNDLHGFRENRNAYIHPEDRKSNFKVEDLRRWSKTIFELGEEKKK